MKNFFRNIFAPFFLMSTAYNETNIIPKEPVKNMRREEMPESMKKIRAEHENQRKLKAIQRMMESQGVHEFWFLDAEGKAVKIVARDKKNAERKFQNTQKV